MELCEESDKDIVEAIRSRKHINAIKLVRAKYNLSLSEAKSLIESHPDYNDRFPPVGGGGSESQGSGLKYLVFVVVIFAIAIVLIKT
ncbi:hypothetical protein Maes01_01108 [Microbulbifer aestuariivivens]|uniref:Ribosomal protein L7/L12 C-terminal domain-containing protein n=1 Tax=Microbulbifer aestuariivivens TaxID=1908308 RepID=A0ABP9WMW2_9GAMM